MVTLTPAQAAELATLLGSNLTRQDADRRQAWIVALTRSGSWVNLSNCPPFTKPAQS